MFPKVEVVAGSIADQDADAVVVNLFQDLAGKGRPKLGGATGALDEASGGMIAAHVARGDFKGKLGDVAVLYPDHLRAKRILVVGLGKKAEFDLDKVRVAAGKAARKAQALRCRSLATIVHGTAIRGLKPEAACEATVEGTMLALHRFEQYKGKKPEDAEPEVDLATVRIVESDKAKLRAFREAARVATVVSESVWYTRDLATLSGRDASPTKYGERAKALGKEVGLHVEVLEKPAIEKLGMGAFLAVNQGSAEPPRFVVLEHNRGKPRLPTVVLVGKGITFDSGGISIKPSEKMEDMKFDKSGACAVFGAMRALALLKVPVHVVGITPFTDNLPSGSAYRPGDVVRAMNGVTIEVVNTDAEGRLVLADALAYADRFHPAAVVDMATLTGACVVALGAQASGLMGTDENLLRRIQDAARATHERVAVLPFYDEYDKLIESKVADVKNSGGRAGGAITAGRFLKKFTGAWPWAHLDIAGTAWSEGSNSYNEAYSPTQASGVGVRLMVRMLREWKA